MQAFDCPLCGWKGHPSFELTAAGKLAAKCGKDTCTYVDSKLGPNNFGRDQVVSIEGTKVLVEMVDRQASPTEEPVVAPQRAVSAVRPRTPPIRDLSEPVDAIALIKSRRDFLEREVARMEGFKAELRKLNKMLSAAYREDRAVLTSRPNLVGDAE